MVQECFVIQWRTATRFEVDRGTVAAHREVMTLVPEEDLTQFQIAERRDVPLGTVKTRMFHGMRALRTALAERGFDAA
jgi:RNA polymerase sigma-70 factor, ECF subfamily